MMFEPNVDNYQQKNLFYTKKNWEKLPRTISSTQNINDIKKLIQSYSWHRAKSFVYCFSIWRCTVIDPPDFFCEPLASPVPVGSLSCDMILSTFYTKMFNLINKNLTKMSCNTQNSTSKIKILKVLKLPPALLRGLAFFARKSNRPSCLKGVRWCQQFWTTKIQLCSKLVRLLIETFWFTTNENMTCKKYNYTKTVIWEDASNE